MYVEASIAKSALVESVYCCCYFCCIVCGVLPGNFETCIAVIIASAAPVSTKTCQLKEVFILESHVGYIMTKGSDMGFQLRTMDHVLVVPIFRGSSLEIPNQCCSFPRI